MIKRERHKLQHKITHQQKTAKKNPFALHIIAGCSNKIQATSNGKKTLKQELKSRKRRNRNGNQNEESFKTHKYREK